MNRSAFSVPPQQLERRSEHWAMKERMVSPMNKMMLLLLAVGLSTANVRAAENLRLNPKLDYSSDSQDGPLITGDHMEEGAVRGKPNYVFMFGEG